MELVHIKLLVVQLGHEIHDIQTVDFSFQAEIRIAQSKETELFPHTQSICFSQAARVNHNTFKLALHKQWQNPRSLNIKNFLQHLHHDRRQKAHGDLSVQTF